MPDHAMQVRNEDVSGTDASDAPPRERELRPYTNAQSWVPSRSSLIFRSFGPRQQLVPSIVTDDRVYVLRGAFVLDIEYQENDTVFVYHHSLPVSGYGDDVDGALDSFCEAFDVQYRGLVESDPEELTPAARAAAKEIEAAVTEVRTT